MKRFTSILLVIFSALSSFSQEIHGSVFEDLNQNSLFDPDEEGVENIRVSDGYQIVKTRKNGDYRLTPHPAARFLFVTTPSGYKNSQKHYIPLEEARKNAAFSLVKDTVQQPDYLRFVQVTDTETPLYGPWIDNVRNFAKKQQVSFVMHTGDICYETGMRFHAQQVNSRLIGKPVYYTVGNHDLVKGEYGEKLFEDLFGPTYYSFEAGPAHFVVTPMPHGDYKPSYTADQIIRWLKKDLALKDPDKPLIFINHDFFTGVNFVLRGEHEEIDLQAFNLQAWLYGHWHNNYVFKQNGVYVVCSGAPNKGGIDNSAGQFLAIDINKDGVKDIRSIYTNLQSHIQILPIPMDRTDILPIDVIAYDSERQITNVVADIYDKRGHRISSTALSPVGAWHWQQAIPARPELQVQEICVTISYADGQYDIRKHRVEDDSGPAASPLKIIWRKTLGGNIWKTRPLVVDNQLFIGTMDDGLGRQQALYALSKEDGKQLWKAPTTNSIKHTLHYVDGILLATDVAGRVYALNGRDGDIKWTKALTETSRIPTFVSGPALLDHTYYTGLGDRLSAFDIFTGETRWRATEKVGGEATPAAFEVTDKMLYTGINWNALFAYDRETGQFRWKRNDDGLRFRSGGVTVHRDTLYTTGLNGLFKLDPRTGKTLFQRTTTDDFKVMASPLITENLLIMPTSTAGIKAFDRATLTEKWQFQTGEALVYTAPYSTPDQRQIVATVESNVIESEGNLYFGASDGYFYILDMDGNLQQKVKIGAPIFADPFIDNDRIYVADFSGTVTCLERR
ncbi:outer membrane protein assembly factor BamB family protein [Sphingobacterium suaedae]|uniref:PQQ-binding-like beta-propeller repeat protein n=1 Tax=Sphingobacterium suaedae TaxID=1686402 RepID=A0ABW5KL32_9SPHI